MIDWETIDTVLLDMDGTLLDLRYDNTLWNTLLPERYSEARSMSLEAAREHLFSHMLDRRGELDFYCLDYWAAFTGLDVVALHHELTDMISYRPNATAFLKQLSRCGRHRVLVTNAHRDSLGVKDLHSGLTSKLDASVSCHDYGAPKESATFWERLLIEHPFDPARTLLIDDNAAVLDSADRFGIAFLLTIAQPDSARPAREDLAHPTVDDFQDLMTNLTPRRADGGHGAPL